MDARRALLDWFGPRRRAYPWRLRPRPYRVLVSEVMLQQTRAARVVPAFRAFVRRFPDVRVLASASRADVLRAWAGLGYNRRAVYLHEAARAVVREHGGRVPRDPEALERLPGVGAYTAAAVASIGHGAPVAAVDVNVARVVARHRLGAEAHEASGARLRELAGDWLDRRDPAAWNQALMDLGREVCRPIPRCSECPLASTCRFRASGRRARPGPRRQGRFEGSHRQVRGRVVALLAERDAASLATLSVGAGVPIERVAEAVGALSREGLVEAGPAALAGRATGRVRLPRG